MRRGREREERRKVKRAKAEEKKEKRKRERNVEREDLEERRYMVEEIMRKILGRIVGIIGLEERKEEAGRWVIILELEEIADKEEILEKRVMIGHRTPVWSGDG